MNGKPVHVIPARTVINFKSAFSHKLLCDGLTFSAGSACAYSCSFCYVPELMQKSPHLRGIEEKHEAIVLRRADAVRIVREQLTHRTGAPRFLDPADRRVIYASPLVDVAANLDLCAETVAICREILALTHWQIRLLSKSNLLPRIAAELDAYRDRVIYGVSTGTLDDGLARAFEAGTPLVSKRIASLHWLQDHDFRTFGMLCPSLPLFHADDYARFARDCAAAIRAEKCEHVWAEVLNVRGESMTRTCAALLYHGFDDEAARLEHVSTDKAAWEDYARATFEAHAKAYAGQTGPDGTPKLRFLQYVTAASKSWWQARVPDGAILL